jgi:GNAT superfamily N-acetyltransferase
MAANPVETSRTHEHVTCRALSPQEASEQIGALAALLIDCVEGGASVSFMAPLTQDRAAAFWQGVVDGVAAGERILLVAEDRAEGRIVGTVQLVLRQPENQPHRADVAKMLVHRRARRRGIGAALLRAVDDAARQAGKSVLVLDTVTGSDAERLYARAGWTRVGVIPNYALWPRGGFCDTTFFCKQIPPA